MTIDPRPILVTGAAGWLGAALVPRLVAAGARVRCLAHRRSPPPAHEQVEGDLRDRGAVETALAGCCAVLHLAARTRSPDGAAYREINVEATANLASAARAAGIQRFVHVSSRTAVPGAGAYGESKLEGERRVRTTLPSALVLRPSEVYGAGSGDAVGKLLDLLARFPVAPSLREPRARVAPLYVDDFLAACCRAVLDPAVPRELYVLAGPEEMTVGQFMRRAARALGRRVLLVPVPLFVVRVAMASRRGGLVPDRLDALLATKPTDIEPARRHLGFSPRALEAGVLEWARTRAPARRGHARASSQISASEASEAPPPTRSDPGR